ncbi:MAG: lysylphosphatidylglycerol synthase domain-containing protein [Pseudomonadota bacterium]
MTEIRRMKASTWRGWLMAGFITAVCVAFGMILLDLGNSAKGLMQIGPFAWISVIGLSLLMALLRAARVALLVQVTQLAPVVKASFLHGAANAVLPARIGEAVLPLALARYSGLDLVRAVGLLLIVRLGDLAVLIGLGLLFVAAVDAWNHTNALRITLAFCGFTLIVCVSVVPTFVSGLGHLTPTALRAFADRVAAAGSTLAVNTKVSLAVLTVAIWLTLGIAAHISIAAAGIQVDLTYAFLAAIAASLAFALPTNGIASIGPFEAAFVATLALSGASAELALTAAIHLHLCALIAAGLTALSTTLFPVSWGDRPVCP